MSGEICIGAVSIAMGTVAAVSYLRIKNRLEKGFGTSVDSGDLDFSAMKVDESREQKSLRKRVRSTDENGIFVDVGNPTVEYVQIVCRGEKGDLPAHRNPFLHIERLTSQMKDEIKSGLMIQNPSGFFFRPNDFKPYNNPPNLNRPDWDRGTSVLSNDGLSFKLDFSTAKIVGNMELGYEAVGIAENALKQASANYEYGKSLVSAGHSGGGLKMIKEGEKMMAKAMSDAEKINKKLEEVVGEVKDANNGIRYPDTNHKRPDYEKNTDVLVNGRSPEVPRPSTTSVADSNYYEDFSRF